MQNNYYFLRQLTKQLAFKLDGLTLMECFSQEKDELVLGFAAARGKKKNYKEFFIKAVVYPDFSCLYFPEQFERARKNSADIFSQLLDKQIVSVQQFLNERCFAIHFEENFSLLFKLYSNRSNILLFQNNEVIDSFHSRIVADKQLKINELDREINQSFEGFLKAEENYKKLFPTFGKIITEELGSKNISWEVIQEILQKLKKPSYYLTKINQETHLSLLPVGEIIKEFHEPIEAINSFYIKHTKTNTIEQEKAVVFRKLLKEKRQTETYLQASYERLEKVEDGVKNEEIGHILMANLHQINIENLRNISNVQLFDFYRDKTIDIKLKPDLSPQRNAENYYRKAKNEKIEIEKLQENIENREKLLAILNTRITDIESFESLKELRNYLKINNLTNKEAVKIITSLFKKFECEGFEILVGKNSKNNDLLTQQYAYKEDIWLHARDAQGSHVVIKYQAGKKIPNSVLERAASLAAYFSKRRNETLAPVIYTPKKFVRKPKGAADGMVIVEKEEVIMVEPKLE